MFAYCEGFLFDVLNENMKHRSTTQYRSVMVMMKLTKHSVFSRTTTRSTSGLSPGVAATDVTGRMLAYRSSSFLRATMGEEYPATFLDGELFHDMRCSSTKDTATYLTEPKSAQSHSFFKMLTVSSGKAVPLFVKCSKPAKSSMNSGLGTSDPTANMAACAACPYHFD